MTCRSVRRITILDKNMISILKSFLPVIVLGFYFCLIRFVNPVNNFSVMSGRVFLG